MTGSAHPPDPASSTDPLVDYLDRVTARLPGPRSAVRAIRDELADGLHEARSRHRARGMAPDAAAHEAVREFGQPDVVVPALLEDLAAVRARRVGLLVVASGPVVGALWLWRLPSTDLAGTGRHPLEALAGVGGPVLAGLLVVAIITVVTAVVTIVARTGIASRWLGSHVSSALRAARFATAVTIAVDLVVVATLMIPGAADPSAAGTGPAVALVLAGTASVVRLIGCVVANHRCRTTLHGLARTGTG